MLSSHFERALEERFTVDRSAAVTVVRARGELDAFSAPDLEAAFADAGAETHVVVDLHSVSFLDSTALGAVVRAVRDIGEPSVKLFP